MTRDVRCEAKEARALVIIQCLTPNVLRFTSNQ